MQTLPFGVIVLCLGAGLIDATARGNAQTVGNPSTEIRATLPNGRTIRPVGTWIPVAPFPFAIAVRPDGNEIAVPSIGFPFALNLIAHPADSTPIVKKWPDSRESEKTIETHAGLAYSPDGKILYLASGNSGKVGIWSAQGGWHQVGSIALDGVVAGRDYKESFAATVLCSRNGKWLYALDQGNWRIVVLNAETRERVASIDTGAYPFGLALSPDETKLYVTNTGLFEYSKIPGATVATASSTGLHFPPFAYPSAAARSGATVEGKQIQGLGDENSDRGSSLWTYNLPADGTPKLAAKLRLGERISGRLVGGAAPTGVVADDDAVYVSLAHQDSIVRVSSDGMRLTSEVALTPFTGKRFLDAQGHALRGVMPSGLALRDGRLYVAESGINAVAVVDTKNMKVVEHIPAGWNPSSVALSPDGTTLYIVNAKGKGSGANGGQAHDAKLPSYIGSLEYGSVSVVKLGTLASAERLTEAVVTTNLAANSTSLKLPRLKHCFLIIRENRTFDEMLGDLAGANGDKTLARYGIAGWAEEEKEAAGLRVTPNLHALAKQFATSDNFYVDGDVSADGHRWVVGINPTPFFNTAWTSGYGGRRKSSAEASQPGRRAMFGGADSPMPEDEPQFGSLWEHIANAGLGILNYGEGLEVEGNDEVEGIEPEGQRLLLNSPVPKPVFESTDRRFPTFNLGIPDQVREAEFERDLRARMAKGKVPGLIVIRLPGDHTSKIRPGDGYPYRASFVADNDLATGRIVEFLSHTDLWQDSAVFVTEDDAQGGVDHVDAHRSILMVASPWTKQGAISHVHTSMGSITRTINELLGVGSMNLEDALAGEMLDVFDGKPHLEPFSAQPSDLRVFDAAKAKVAHPKSKVEAASLRRMDDPAEIGPLVESTARHKGSSTK